MAAEAKIPNVLTIAGVDPSGGAGVLADVKAISALSAYACAVVAALTAQNTRAVTGIFAVPPSFVREQIDTLFADVRIDAAKIGMVGQAPVMQADVAAVQARGALVGGNLAAIGRDDGDFDPAATAPCAITNGLADEAPACVGYATYRWGKGSRVREA